MKVSELEWNELGTTNMFRHPSGRNAWVQKSRTEGLYVLFVVGTGTGELDHYELDTFDLAMLLIPCTPISP